MRTTLKRLARKVKIRKQLPAMTMNGRSRYKIGRLYARSMRSAKQHPFLSLGTTALALGAVSGIAAWLRFRK